VRRYIVTAACNLTGKRITKAVTGADAAHVLRAVSPELFSAGYYLVDIREVA
jgi:hypothetical protein